MTTRNRSVIKAEAAYRLALLSLPVINSNVTVLVNEFPKSGGTWLAHMVRDISGVPFPENEFPTQFPCVFHGHYLKKFSSIPMILLWRDPRDIMVSWYYHCLFKTNKNNHDRVDFIRSKMTFDNYDNISENLQHFICFCFKTPLSPKFSWNDFFDLFFSTTSKNHHHTSYELLNLQPEEELKEISKFLNLSVTDDLISDTVKLNSFESLAKRKPGEESKSDFLRKGIVGDWKNVFNAESEEVLNDFLGDRLAAYSDRFYSRRI